MPLQELIDRFSKLRKHPVYQENRALVLWRAGAWSVHCLFGIPARAKFHRWNYRLYLPPKWRGGGSTSPYVFREHYEPELMLLERYLKPGMVFIDGGANTGVFTFTAAQLVGPSGRVLAIEPGSSCVAALQQSAALNDFQHVSIHQTALSDRCGAARLYHHLGQENAFSLGADTNASFDEIKVTTLDALAAEENLPCVDFIKLDVEGAEELALRGGSEIISRWRPIVLFEVNLDAVNRFNLAADGACRLLAEQGYQLLRLNDDGGLAPTTELPAQLCNFLAVPSEKCAGCQANEGPSLVSANR